LRSPSSATARAWRAASSGPGWRLRAPACSARRWSRRLPACALREATG